jgi:hypothetical protein
MMAEFLQRELTSIAFCWRVERRDGAALGFTSHDRDLTIGGLVYRAAPGMLPSAISLSDGFSTAALDVSGALTSDAIAVADLVAGRWDGAAISVFMVDWEAPDGTQLPIVRGELGDINSRGRGVHGRTERANSGAGPAGGGADLAGMPGRTWRQEVPRGPGGPRAVDADQRSAGRR